MPYIKNGKEQFTMKEKRQYHLEIANSGKKDGVKVDKATQTRHAMLAKEYGDKLQTFMAHDKTDRERMTRGEKPIGKPKFN